MKTQKRRFLVKRPHKMSITKTKDLIRIFNKNNEKMKAINRDLTLF